MMAPGTVAAAPMRAVYSGISAVAIDLAALLARVQSSANGAIVLFAGTVRNTNDGKPVLRMEYSAYAGMANRVLAEIVDEACERMSVSHVAVEHRIGLLELGEVSVAIAVAHPHRAAAYEASRYIIEEIKKRVPIWKLEHYEDGQREWVDPTRARRGGAESA